MISRLTAIAAAFAAALTVLATASLAFAAEARQGDSLTQQAAAKPVRSIQLERVVITAKRLPQESR